MQFIEICWVFDVSVNFISFAMKASSSEYLESSSWTWLKGGSLNFKCIDMPDILTFNHLDNLVFWRLTVSDTTSYHSYQLRIHELSQDVWINSTYHSPPDFGLEGCDRSSLQMFERLPGRGRSQPAVNCVGLVTNGMGQARRIALKTLSCISEEGNTQVCGVFDLADSDLFNKSTWFPDWVDCRWLSYLLEQFGLLGNVSPSLDRLLASFATIWHVATCSRRRHVFRKVFHTKMMGTELWRMEAGTPNEQWAKAVEATAIKGLTKVAGIGWRCALNIRHVQLFF